jgi:uncharacterized protein (DUF58 family)
LSAADDTWARAALAAGRAAGLRYRLALPREAMRGVGGSWLGTRSGASLDFQDYRDYHPGDDLRHIDWNVYARSDREVVKLFREEVAPHADIVLDGSRSMRLEGTDKGRAALMLAAALAAAAENARCSHAVWTAGARVAPLEGSRREVGAWRPPAFDEGVSPEAGLSRGARPWRRRGVRVFVSDLLWPAEPEAVVRRLADGAAALTVIQVLAGEEESPALRGQHRLLDVESGDRVDVFVDASACAVYEAALRRHRDGWSRACRSAGARFVTVTAERLLEDGRMPALEKSGVVGS